MKRSDRYLWLVLLTASSGFLLILSIRLGLGLEGLFPSIPGERTQLLSPVEQIAAEDLTIPDLVLLGARQEVKNRTRYDASYQSIPYPGGDVPSDRGACTDVVIRAFRNAGIDLQLLIHEDMRDNFSLYPQKWELREPDPNIDHRRVPNQMRFFERHWESLSIEKEDILEQGQWGDIVVWRFPTGQYHVGVVSDRTTINGIPLAIHNGSTAREENCLFRWEIIGYYRYPLRTDL